MRRRAVRFAAGVALALGAVLAQAESGIAAPPATSPSQEPVLTVGDRKVTAEELNAQLSYEPALLIDKARYDANYARLFAITWYEEELLATAAQDDGFLARTPGLAGAARNRGRTLIATEYAQSILSEDYAPSDTEIQTYYTMHPQRCERPARYHLARIGVQIPKRASTDEVEAAKRRLVVMQDRLKSGSSFEEVADELSDFTSKEAGGDLGWFEGDKLGQEEGAKIVRALAVGATSEPIKTDAGLEIFKLLGKEDAKRETLAECRPKIVEQINGEYRKAAIRRRVDELAKRYGASMNIDAFLSVVSSAKGKPGVPGAGGAAPLPPIP